MKNFYLTLAILFTISIKAQNYSVEYHKVESELTKESKLGSDSTFYYDYLETPFNEGDSVYIRIVSTQLVPYIAIQSPIEGEKQVFIEPEGKYNSINHGFVAKHTGNYIIYVMASVENTGVFQFELWIANKESLVRPQTSNLCHSISFLKAHLKGGFFFLKEKEKDYSVSSSNFLLLNCDSAEIIRPGEERYSAHLYRGDNKVAVDELYQKLQKEIPECLGADWVVEKKERARYSFLGMIYADEGYSWSKQIDDKTIVVSIELTDNTENDETSYDFDLEFVMRYKESD